MCGGVTVDLRPLGHHQNDSNYINDLHWHSCFSVRAMRAISANINHCIYKYIQIGPDHVPTSELQLNLNCRLKVNWRIVCLASSPNFILQFTSGLQFTFSCNSLVHDLGLNCGLLKSCTGHHYLVVC